jgi:hypothetical protein
MSDETKPDVPTTQQPTSESATPQTPKKKKLTLDIEEVDVSEVLERKISA